MIKIPAKVGRLNDMLEFLGLAMDKAGVDSRQQKNVFISAEEIFVNISSYAYPHGDGDITVCMEISPENIFIEFIDRGVTYNPLDREDPDTTLSLEEREIGGLGIFMVKNLMDHMSYRHEDGRNILTIQKNFGAPHGK